MNSFDAMLDHYDFVLPKELIAVTPAHPRDSARLMIYDRIRDVVTLETFRNIGKYLPKNAVLVLNDTKVFPARMELTKSTGGGVSALYLSDDGTSIRVMATGTLRAGDVLSWENGLTLTVETRDGKEATFRPDFLIADLPSLLEKFGHTPLPPYIGESPLTEKQRRTEYQTVFAENRGSIAAPTAGLHFTEELLQDLQKTGIDVERITLHVHLGTFAPLEEKQWQERKLHTERYRIDESVAGRLNAAKREGRPVVAVGTTTVRTLESAVGSSDGFLRNLEGSTSLFLTEETPLRFVDHLVTNFHLPRSSLLMLVSALTGREKLLDLYKQAIAERLRFFSFGDALLIL